MPEILRDPIGRKPFSLRSVTDMTFLAAANADLAICDSLLRGDNDANPFVVAKAKISLAELFSNWKRSWPKSYASWCRPELRLVIGQRSDRDIATGRDRIYQSWFVVSDNDCIVAWLAPVNDTDDVDSLPSEKLSAGARYLAPELAEPRRYFVGIDAPSHAKKRWVLPPYLDMPASGADFATAAKQLSGQGLDVGVVAAQLGGAKLRCYTVTSQGQFVLYKEGTRNDQLYVVDIRNLECIVTLDNPVPILDHYFSKVIDSSIAFNV